MLTTSESRHLCAPRHDDRAAGDGVSAGSNSIRILRASIKSSVENVCMKEDVKPAAQVLA